MHCYHQCTDHHWCNGTTGDSTKFPSTVKLSKGYQNANRPLLLSSQNGFSTICGTSVHAGESPKESPGSNESMKKSICFAIRTASVEASVETSVKASVAPGASVVVFSGRPASASVVPLVSRDIW